MLNIFRYLTITRSLLRVPTYLLLLMYLLVGVFAGLVVMNIRPDGSQFMFILFEAAICAVIIALWYINGTALNDYADYEIDLINLKNDPDRPLVTGMAKKHELLYVAGACGLIAIGLAAIFSWQYVALVTLLLLLNASYSLKPFQISHRGALAPILLPLGYVVLPFFLGYWLNSAEWSRLVGVLIAAMYMQFTGRIILKDYRDVKGDKKHGKMTFLLRYGNSIVCAVSATTITVSGLILVLFVGSYLGVFRYAIVCLVCFGITTLYQLSKVSAWPKQKPLIAAFGRAMTGVTTAMIVGLAVTIWTTPKLTTLLMAVALVLVYAWSAQQAFKYNVVLLSKKAT